MGVEDRWSLFVAYFCESTQNLFLQSKNKKQPKCVENLSLTSPLTSENQLQYLHSASKLSQRKKTDIHKQYLQFQNRNLGSAK